METSLLWALRPELVDVSRIPVDPGAGHPYAMGGDVRLSNRQVGVRMVADEVEWFRRKTKELLDEYERLKPSHNFTTFKDVKAAWNEVVEPRLKDFETMQEDWSRGEEIPETSIWNKNKAIYP